MPNLPTNPMTVVRLQVDSFQRLNAARLEPSPTGLIPVRGKNEAGKSSLIEAMLAALLGAKAAPALPITEGAHGAQVILDLGEIVVSRRWKRDSGGKAKTSLTVEAADGSPIRSPQGILDNLVGRFADPVAFLDMKPDEQVKTVLAITGLDQPLRDLEAEAAVHYDRRRDLGRDKDRLAKASDAMQMEVDLLPKLGEGSRPIEELTQALEEANEIDGAIAAATQALNDAESLGKRAAAEVETLQAKAKEWEEEAERSRNAWRAAKTTLAQLTAVDTTPIRDAIHEHEKHAEIDTKRSLAATALAKYEEADQEHDAEEEALGNVRSNIAKLLADAPFPVDGMSYDHEGKVLSINGIPFAQASQAQRLKAAAAVAMAGDPAIRVMFARDGSLLDGDSKRLLAEAATAAGFQFWLEVVDDTKEGAGIWIEDGEAVDAS